MNSFLILSVTPSPGWKEGKGDHTNHENVEGGFTLTVSGNGVGLPEGPDFRKALSPGLQLMISPVTQIKGVMEHDGSGGTAFRTDFRRNNVGGGSRFGK
jgi:two-component sensor histidine kinase